MPPDPFAHLRARLATELAGQAGVVSRAQARQLGLTDDDLRRLRRRRDLTPLWPGVYVNHTGEPSWIQHAWGAVLTTWPAALSHESALRIAEGPGSRRAEFPIEVIVHRDRRLVAPDGVRIHRSAAVDERVLWNLAPPRVRYDEAALDVAARAPDDFAALSLLAAACQQRRTTAQRLTASLESRPRLARKVWLGAVLRDVAEGACSTLEHGYLQRVERAHGLSQARRQVRDRIGAGVVYRDAEYVGGLIVELDGRLFHDTTTQRDSDFDRDLEAAVGGKESVRLSWGQVFARPCWTAARLAVLLERRGWTGQARPCGPDCVLRG